MKSFSWLKNIKNRKYPFWRFDTFFSNHKQRDIEIICNGGWHFTNVKSPEDLFIKLSNFGHHNEFELSGLTVKDLELQIKNKVINYNHFADKTNENKYNVEYSLKKLDIKLLPKYLELNKEKYNKWFD